MQRQRPFVITLINESKAIINIRLTKIGSEDLIPMIVVERSILVMSLRLLDNII